jgi:[histone H4]-N-methyl-L-lysine20 N-methyltransferase
LISLKEEKEHDPNITGRNFTVVTSSLNNCLLLFLGPGRFANHDCEGNAESQRANSGMQIIATRYIQVGEEITAKCGNHYFIKDNCDYLCATCASNYGAKLMGR